MRKKFFNISSNQKGHILQWLIIIILIEVVLFFSFSISPWIIVVAVGFGFMVGFLLRIFKIYPGEDEPLVLDISSAIIAFILAYLITFARGVSLVVSKLIVPFIILIPHFVYIISDKEIKNPVIITWIKNFWRNLLARFK